MPSPLEYYEAFQSGEGALEQEERIQIVRGWAQGVFGDVVDIGCNDGRLSGLLRGPGRRVIGVDVNDEHLRRAAKCLDGVANFDSTTEWPFASGSLGAIHMGAVIEHVFDYRSMFAESARVLRDQGGKLWISVPNMACLRHRVEVLLGFMPAWYRNYEHIRPWTVRFLDEQLKPLGFVRTRLRGAHVREGVAVRAISRWFPTLSSIFVVEYEKRTVPGSRPKDPNAQATTDAKATA